MQRSSMATVCHVFFYITPTLLSLLLLLRLCPLLPGNGTRDRVLTCSFDTGGASFSVLGLSRFS